MTFIFDKKKTQKQLSEAFEQLSGKEVVLFFSTGADAIASYLRLVKNNIKPILVYQYFLPELTFVNNYLDYFEKQIGQKILRYPSNLAVEYLKQTNFQPNIFNQKLQIFYEREEVVSLCHKLKLPIALGLRYTDGVNRIRTISVNGVLNDRRFLPIADCTLNDVVSEIKKSGLYVPFEYAHVGYSFERLYPTVCQMMIKHCPQSWKDVLKIFPFAKAFEYNNSHQYYDKYMTQRIKNFSELAIKKELYERW